MNTAFALVQLRYCQALEQPSETMSIAGDSTVALLHAAYRYAFSLTYNKSDAEDLVQSGWLRVRERYGADVDRRLLFRTLRNLFVDEYRHKKRFPTEFLESMDMLPTADGLQAQGYDPAISRQLRRLRDVEREALFLSVIEGYTASEIAALTGSTRGSVLSMVHRARKKLQSWLAEPTSKDRDNREPSVAGTSYGGGADKRSDADTGSCGSEVLSPKLVEKNRRSSE